MHLNRLTGMFVPRNWGKMIVAHQSPPTLHHKPGVHAGSFNSATLYFDQPVMIKIP